MRLEGVELRLVELELRRTVGTAQGPHRRRTVAVARVVTDAAVGWGECGALPGGTLVDPPLEAVWPVLTELGPHRLAAAARARGGRLPPAAQVASLFDTGPVGRLVAATLEMAVLDAELRAGAVALWERLGVEPAVARSGVPAGALVGIPRDRDPEVLLADVGHAVAAGAARVRLKVEPGWDREPVAAVRRAHPQLPLQVDANGSYLLDSGDERDAARLSALDALGLTCVEQPLPPSDLPSHALLATRLATPVCLDESLATDRHVVDALRYRACGAACLKPARLGGLLAARRAVERCRAAGVPAFVGGFFETGLARSANAALAGLPGFSWPGDVSDPSGYLVADPFPSLRSADGRVHLSGAPGVGGPPDEATLAAVTAATVWRPSPH